MEPKISVLTPSIRPYGLLITQKSLVNQSFKDFEWLTEIGIPQRGHDLNAAYNRMLRRARGELVVSLQDFITLEEDGLEQFWEAYQKNKRCFFTAPVGKRNKDNVEWDWRAHPDAKMSWQRWEIDWGAAPLSALKEIGGFDEAIDGTWSSDNVNVACRAELAGYEFACLIDNKAVAEDHNKFIKHPFAHLYNPEANNLRLELFRNGFKLDPIP